MESERAAIVSWERSWTVCEPMRPLPHLASCARMTGPKVSHSSNHAASSFRLRRATKLVVMELSIAGAFVAAVGGSHEPDSSAGLWSGFENASEDTAMRGLSLAKTEPYEGLFATRGR